MGATPRIQFLSGEPIPHRVFIPSMSSCSPPGQWRDYFLLKGGPGCGKSTLMRRVGKAMEEHGLGVEYIQCSGDPDSLDAVHILALHAAVVDATAPHHRAHPVPARWSGT